MPPGNGMITPSTERIAPAARRQADPPRRGLRRAQGRCRVAAEHDQVAAGHALDDAEALLHEELALHHRHPPISLPVEHLARLIPVAEEAQLTADVDGVLDVVEAVEAGRRRRREHALPDALDQSL